MCERLLEAQEIWQARAWARDSVTPNVIIPHFSGKPGRANERYASCWTSERVYTHIYVHIYIYIDTNN